MGLVPPYVTNLGLDNFDIDTTSLVYGPGLHTLIINATVDAKNFVISGTDASQTFNVAFTCSVASMTSTTTLQDVLHLLLVSPNVVTTIPLPSFIYLPSYCKTTGNPSVVWSVVGLPSYATYNLATNSLLIDSTSATGTEVGIYPI